MPRPAPMTPLQTVAMGLVLTLVDAVIAGYDAVPDVLGWVLVVAGLHRLRDRIGVATLVGLAVVAGLVSLAGLRPELLRGVPESTGWLLSLPQLVFSVLLATALAPVLASTGHADLARRMLRLRWAFAAAAVGPVLLYGGGVDLLLVPLAVLTVAANVYLVYLLFRASRALAGRREPHPR